MPSPPPLWKTVGQEEFEEDLPRGPTELREGIDRSDYIEKDCTLLQLNVFPPLGIMPRRQNSRDNPGASIDLVFHNDYWLDSSERTKYAAFYFRQRGVAFTQSERSFPIPEPPNYHVKLEDINLWPADGSDSEGSQNEEESAGRKTYSPQQTDESHSLAESGTNLNEEVQNQTGDQSHLIPNPFIRYSLVALLFYAILVTSVSTLRLIIAILTSQKASPNIAQVQEPANVVANLTVFDDYLALRLAFGLVPMSWRQDILQQSIFVSQKHEYDSGHMKRSQLAIEHVCHALLKFGTVWEEGKGMSVPQGDHRIFPDDLPSLEIDINNDDGQETVDVYKLCSTVLADVKDTWILTNRVLEEFYSSWPNHASKSMSLLLWRLDRFDKFKHGSMGFSNSESQDWVPGQPFEQRYPLAALVFLNASLGEASSIVKSGFTEDDEMVTYLLGAMIEAEEELAEARQVVNNARSALIRLTEDMRQLFYVAGRLAVSMEVGSKMHNPLKWLNLRRLAGAVDGGAVKGVKRSFAVARDSLDSWIKEDETVLAEQERLRTLVQRLLNRSHLNWFNNLPATGHDNPWRERLLIRNLVNGTHWCPDAACRSKLFDRDKNHEIDVHLVPPSDQHIIEKIIEVNAELEKLLGIWESQVHDSEHARDSAAS